MCLCYVLQAQGSNQRFWPVIKEKINCNYHQAELHLKNAFSEVWGKIDLVQFFVTLKTQLL